MKKTVLLIATILIMIFSGCTSWKADDEPGASNPYVSFKIKDLKTGDDITSQVSSNTFNRDIKIEITGASGSIYYTDNGEDPLVVKKAYTEPIVISGNNTVKTIKAAVVVGDKSSEVISKTFVINYDKLSTPKLYASTYPSVVEASDGQTFDTPVQLQIGGDVNGNLKYTIDGSDPKNSSTAIIAEPYGGAKIDVNQDMVIKIYSYRDGYESSDVAIFQFYVRFTEVATAFSSISCFNCSKFLIDSADKLILVYEDKENNDRLRAIRFNGSQKEDLGFISEGTVYNHQYQVVIGPDNKPIVGFSDSRSGNRPHIKKWLNGTTWETLYEAPEGSLNFSLGVDNNSKPIITLVSGMGYSFDKHVYSWVSGTTWEDLGYAAGFTPIIVDTDNKPIVFYSDTNNRLAVKKWVSGTTWKNIGTLSSEGVENLGAIKRGDGKIFVYFYDNFYKQTRFLVREAGNSWNEIAPKMDSYVSPSDITLDKQNNPVLIKTTSSYGGDYKQSVYKINGSTWQEEHQLTGLNKMVVDSNNKLILLQGENYTAPTIYKQVR